MRKNNSVLYLVLSLLFLFLFIGLTYIVMTFSVQAIGPEGSRIGMSEVNAFFAQRLPFHPVFYRISKVLGFLILGLAAGFALLTLIQMIRRRSPFRADPDLLTLLLSYELVLAFYLLFETFIINYRPVILGEGLEASFPSSHTLIAVTVMGIAMDQARRRLPYGIPCLAARILCILLLVGTVLTRFLSGVHWFTDILGGLLLGLSIVLFYRGLSERFSP